MIDFRNEFLADINAGMWTGLKWLAVFVLLAMVGLYACCCSTKTLIINEHGINATSSAFLYCPEAAAIQLHDGNRTGNMTVDESGVGKTVQALGDNAVEVLKP